MPRRPRPVSRKPPPTAPVQQQEAVSSKTSDKKKKLACSTYSLELQSPAEASIVQASCPSSAEWDESDGEDEDSEVEDEDLDADAPRIAQWVDEDELEVESSEEEEDPSDEEDDTKPADMGYLQNTLSALPFGTLRKAQNTLIAEDAGSEGSSGGSEPEEEPSAFSTKPKGKDREKRTLEKRKNKHAPMEMTSKKPVGRKKIEIENKGPVPRDPRFLPLVGEFSAPRFQSQYSFLTSIHKDELSTLRDNIKRARKMLLTTPRDMREEAQAEVARLERALKRAESTVNKDRREKVEQQAMEKISKEEREKRKMGKGAWYMKQNDKKELLVRAKYEALEEDGGKSAVKRAIEKKQKKVNSKERKRRPFSVNQSRGGSDSGWAGKRMRDAAAGERIPNKRQRVS
ncbi:hypothetical protein EUX98_g136 [Antrodiella citrinella]|uniref:rRNA biogenesis protein RRP36 n=1 Tax=Antrodiella citrinella TaxID=2447956 RepID=A0A4S4N7M1_9APHY|nr:hypothetical protein EUX98_g136 [Antrodiella citrinella]